MFSIQTNVNSLIAQENMRVNGDFQSKTIQRLTSGYRINQSGDDAAGLAVANKFRSDVAELSQGVRNANDGISTLQIIDGGMNNISKMIDRLKTLASQSASQTFTGDRKVLNDEFQTLLKEIDRQAQAVGLDQGGLYAKSLSVFVGGGRSAGIGAVDTGNGTVKLDLAGAAVDTKSLSLKGMQAVAGTDTTDIGTGSATHTVSDILADLGNTSDLAGYTNFYVSGAGFSDDNKVKVAVNLTGVSDIDTLATAINDAIESAGADASSAATAFKNAGVSASVYTNESGGKQLAFNSSYAPIQVQAGDVMANALMGNFSVEEGDPATRGAAMSSSVHGVNTTAGTLGAADVTVRIVGGGMSSPVDIQLDGGQTTASAIASLTAQISANADLVAAGLSVSSGAVGSSPLTFTNSRGDKFSVEASGDTANLLGLGAFNSGAAGAVDYTTLTGSVYSASTTRDTSTLEISLNGGAAQQITVDLTAGDATAAKELSGVVGSNDIDATNDTLDLTIDGQSVTVSLTQNTGVTELTLAGEIQAAIDGAGLTGGAHATVSVTQDGRIQIENDNKGGAHTLLAAGNAVSSGLLGFTLTAGSNRTAGDIADNINQQIAANTNLQKAALKATVDTGALKLDSNGTFFRVNGGAGASDANIGFGVSASSFTGAAATNLAAATSARASVDSNGAQQTNSMAFTAPTYATDSQTLTVSVNDADGNIQSKVISLHNDTTARSARSIDEAVAAINKQLQQSNIAALQGIVAVKENVSGTEKINFLSSGNSFQVSASGTTNNAGVDGNGAAAGTAGSVESEVAGEVSSTVSIDSMSNALKAVSSISAAITKLGSAQAAVGRGQNQLSYALSLAQSQISSFSAAESRIRDADVASEAANLTKAQVLQQAAVAAMAQANSAPQVILSLLRG